LLLVTLVVAACTAPIEFSKNTEGFLLNTDAQGVVLEGHDAVALVVAGQRVAGSSEYQATFEGGTYLFSSAENRELFSAHPGRFAPQFGGFCSMAAALGKVEPGSVQFSSVIEGRLVVQRNEKAAEFWHQNPHGNLAKADARWPRLVARAPGPQR
jgi:YHS domain-containing protein